VALRSRHIAGRQLQQRLRTDPRLLAK
jgi:hypothetical protein